MAGEEGDSQNNQIRSIAWMLKNLRAEGSFRYLDWAQEFSPKNVGIAASRNRTFFRHLELLRVEFLDELAERAELVAEDGVYRLTNGDLEGRFGSIEDLEASNFVPFLQALGSRHSILPFYSPSITKELRKDLDLSSSDLGHIIYKTKSDWRLNRDHLTTFLDAIHQRVRIRVTSGSGRAPTELTPLFVVSYEGSWHLVGIDVRVEQFNLSRIETLELTPTPALVIGKEVQQALRRSIESTFGIYLVTSLESPEASERITMRFFRGAIRYARERFDPALQTKTSPWYRIEDGDGHFDVTVLGHAGAYGELVGEVLRWGADAEAMSPPAFREAWQKQIQALQRYL